jgi:hypothetical protein
MESWDSTDTELLTKLYVIEELELLEICRIMKRKCKVIIAKLIELRIVNSKYDIRGNGVSKSLELQSNVKQTDFISQDKIKSLTQAHNETIELLENVNKIITQASVVCSNYSKLVSTIKNIYTPDNSTQS